VRKIKNKITILQCLAAWLDVLLLLLGMAFIVTGAFLIFQPVGYIVLGLCFIALAFFIAKKQAIRGDS
jgi:hypothetical protein